MSTAVSLYTIEDDLVAMLNSIEMVEDPEARAEAEQAIIDLHLKATDKRDRVSNFLAHCNNQEAFINAEIERLSALKRHFTSARDRVEGMIVATIQNIGPDDSGKWRKLEGRTCSFSLAKKPLATEITSLDQVPAEFKDVSVKMAFEEWAALAGEKQVDVKQFEVTARKAEIKKALDVGEVPGAQLSQLSYRLNRK